MGWIRAAVRVGLLLLWLLVCMMGHGLSRLAGRKPRWPRRFLAGVNRIAGLQIRLHGRPAPSRTLFLANHLSWLDIPALAGTTGTAFVGHGGLADVPLIRRLCALNDTVFVARHDRASIRAQVEDVRLALGELGALTIFPEGTTGDGGALLPFKSSLLSAIEPLAGDVVVQPVWLDYAGAEAIAWFGDEPGVANFLRIVSRRDPLQLAIHFLPTLSGDELTNRKTITAAAREAIVRAKGLHPGGVFA